MAMSSIPSRIPLLPSFQYVVLPGETTCTCIRHKPSIHLIEDITSRSALSKTFLGLVPSTEKQWDSVAALEGNVGTVVLLSQVVYTNWPQPSYSVVMTGLCRFSVEAIVLENPYLLANVDQLEPIMGQLEQNQELASEDAELSELIGQLRGVSERLRAIFRDQLDSHASAKGGLSIGQLTDLLVIFLRPSMTDKLAVLRTVDLKSRLKVALEILNKKMEDVTFIHQQNSRALLPNPRSGQMKGQLSEELIDLQKSLEKAGLSPEASVIAQMEMKRLTQLSPMRPDHGILKNYLEFMASLPWNKLTEDHLDLDNAKSVLDADHFGLEKPKRRILEYLAVRQLKNSLRGPILCLIGAPGVGKTSIGRSIARALERKFHRISLGGVSDQSAIRGHRRTYVGALAGNILNGLRTVGARNPVFLLDEVDKLSRGGFRGDPAAALLEVLDPEQNAHFVDHYLNTPFDLSQVLFIATANTSKSIPPALLDRMEVIKMSGYTEFEKLRIARNHILHKQLEDHGLTENDLDLPDDVIELIIERYTREAGVRSLEHKLSAVCRAVAMRVAQSRSKEAVEKLETCPVRIDAAALEEILGPRRFEHTALCDPRAGVAAGLVWTPVGGEVCTVEASAVPRGNGKLTQLTGRLGMVIRESAMIALTWIKANADTLHIPLDWLRNHDYHVHIPSGAVPKEGPSAGVTLVCALVSLAWGVPLRPFTALTGEVSLHGSVLRVGGIKEKVLAAHRAGVHRVVLPRACAPDLQDIQADVKSKMEFIFVRSLEEVIDAAFDDDQKKGRLLTASEGTPLTSKL